MDSGPLFGLSAAVFSGLLAQAAKGRPVQSAHGLAGGETAGLRRLEDLLTGKGSSTARKGRLSCSKTLRFFSKTLSFVAVRRESRRRGGVHLLGLGRGRPRRLLEAGRISGTRLPLPPADSPSVRGPAGERVDRKPP